MNQEKNNDNDNVKNTTPRPVSNLSPAPRSKPKRTPTVIPTHSIRAHFDSETITLYQAYSQPIATAAVESQSLSASPLFLTSRTTWLKPSWSWMMYRSGYSHKDPNQARILALRIRHADFEEMLSKARLAEEERAKGEVVVQWDPERSVRIGKLEGGVRSIQIGVPGSLVGRLVGEWVVGIEDVTERARGLKGVLDGEGGSKVSMEELVESGFVPVERVYDGMLSREVRVRLGMRADLDRELDGAE